MTLPAWISSSSSSGLLQRRDEVGDRPGRVMPQPAGQQPDRPAAGTRTAARASPTASGSCGRRGIQTGEQLLRLTGGQRFQRQRHGLLQIGQPAPAGYQRQAAARARQHRAYLIDVLRVVQHHQHPLASQQAAVQCACASAPAGNAIRRDPEGVEEPPDRLGRRPSARPMGRGRGGSRTAGRRGTAPPPDSPSAAASVVLPTPAVPSIARTARHARQPGGGYLASSCVSSAQLIAAADECRRLAARQLVAARGAGPGRRGWLASSSSASGR